MTTSSSGLRRSRDVVRPLRRRRATRASTSGWSCFRRYLPKRYQAEKAHVVDSNGVFSEQIDVVIFDRQYSPFIFDYEGQKVVARRERVRAFRGEAGDQRRGGRLRAEDKSQSVRRLHRTSLPIPHAGGTYPPKPLPHILGGLLTFESDWKPADRRRR